MRRGSIELTRVINDNSLGPAGSTQLPAILPAALIRARRATTSAGISVGGSVRRLAGF